MRKPDSSLTYQYGGSLRDWSQIIADVFQPQSAKPVHPEGYKARILQWRLGEVDITHYESAASTYHRTARHIGPGVEDNYFVTLLRSSRALMTLEQNGRSAELGRGQMILHHSAYAAKMKHSGITLTAIRLPGRALRDRLRSPDNSCVTAVPCDRSAGVLFASFADALILNANSLDATVQAPAIEKLLDLLAMAIEANTEDTPLLGSAAQMGHRARVLRYITMHYRDPQLKPKVIAEACRISLRYLHQLFAESELSIGERIIEMRLLEARRLLRAPSESMKSIAQIAYASGFEDLSHFSRRFRSRFAMAPGEARKAG